MFGQRRGQAWRAVGLGVHLTNRTTFTRSSPSLRRFKALAIHLGRAQEELGIVRAGARVVTAHTQSKTPSSALSSASCTASPAACTSAAATPCIAATAGPPPTAARCTSKVVPPSPTSATSRTRRIRRPDAKRPGHGCRLSRRRSATPTPFGIEEMHRPAGHETVVGRLHRRYVEGGEDAPRPGSGPSYRPLNRIQEAGNARVLSLASSAA